MSSQPPATPSTGTSKSAAKKRAKKAAKALAANKESIAAAVASSATAALSDPDTAARLAALEATYSLPPGSYPDAGYDRAYHDDAELPPAAAAGATGGANPDQFSFASYAFDRNLVAQANGSPFSGLSPSINITHEDLLETANELWKRMGETAYGEDDPYWSSLPTHVRQFIREAIPFNGNAPNNVNDPQATQKDLYAMAQRIVHAASQGMGLQGVGSNLLSQVNGRAHLQASIAEDLGFHRHPDAAGRAAEDDFEDEDEFDEELEPGYAQPNGDAPKKKNKKKKKKSTQVQEPPPAALPPPAVKQPPRQPVPPQPSVAPAQAASAAATTAAAAAPALNPPPPPVSAAPTNPPPSSRAAGKQPMPHAPQPPPNMVRSLRAAGKAPVSATSQTHHNHTHTHTAPASAKAPATKGKAVANTPPAKIWTTASAEERENITQFWLGLTEAERRDLLQIEKDAVLRRMKEQQRHSCGCAVCGRKKVNIEMELDQLYEQYYEDLERYTQHQRAAIVNDDCPRPPGAGPFPGSVELDPSGQLLKLDHLAPSAAQQASVEESDEYDDDDDYEDEEELDDDEIVSEEAETGSYAPRSKSGTKPATPKPEGGDDFYGFGSNLATIKGVITVADDMLKNDGAKFLEMMEQLAVKRVAREELNVRELQEETDEDEEEVDDISDAQRMEDGKRMFAIFAARMFEQRVLQAYRERVAKEREEQLLRELEMEEDSKRAREEKKAKEAQRKKDKKRWVLRPRSVLIGAELRSNVKTRSALPVRPSSPRSSVWPSSRRRKTHASGQRGRRRSARAARPPSVPPRKRLCARRPSGGNGKRRNGPARKRQHARSANFRRRSRRNARRANARPRRRSAVSARSGSVSQRNAPRRSGSQRRLVKRPRRSVWPSSRRSVSRSSDATRLRAVSVRLLSRRRFLLLSKPRASVPQPRRLLQRRPPPTRPRWAELRFAPLPVFAPRSQPRCRLAFATDRARPATVLSLLRHPRRRPFVRARSPAVPPRRPRRHTTASQCLPCPRSTLARQGLVDLCREPSAPARRSLLSHQCSPLRRPTAARA